MEFEPTSELAEFVGIMLGDGCIGTYLCASGDRTKIQNRVKITINSENERLYARTCIIPLIEQLFLVQPVLCKRKGERTIDIQIFGKKIVETLTEEVGLEPSPKFGKAIIPDWIFQHSLELDTLRGLFDTDGCVVFDKQNREVPYYPRLEVKVSPSPLSHQVPEVLTRYNFRHSVCQNTGSNTTRFQINGSRLFDKWAVEVGFHNPKHLYKYLFWKQNGYSPSVVINQK